MSAPVMVNGQGPFDFVVDTGANRSIIATELAEQLGLPAGNPTRVHGINAERPPAPAMAAPREEEAEQLPQGIEPEASGHHGITRKMALEEPQVRPDIELGVQLAVIVRAAPR